MKKKLLLRFADWLEENIKEDQFDFSEVKSECGTVGCAIGWLPTFHKTRRSKSILCTDGDMYFIYKGTLFQYAELAQKYFGISSIDESWCLFSQRCQGDIPGWGDFPVCNDYATPKDVANAIRHYVEIRS